MEAGWVGVMRGRGVDVHRLSVGQARSPIWSILTKRRQIGFLLINVLNSNK